MRRLFSALQQLWGHRSLVFQLARREVLGRYRGSFGGMAWSFITPLLLLTVYTFVFGTVLPSRWPHTDSHASPFQFALVLFAGLIPFNLFSEVANRAPSLVLSNPNYVTKVVFPLEVLPLTALLAAFYHALLSLVVLIVFEIILLDAIPGTFILLPLVWFPFLMLLAGIAWWLSALGVYLRDIGQLIGMVVTVLMFLSPVFYPIAALPKWVANSMWLNPLAFTLEATRDVMLWGRVPDIMIWIGQSVISLLMALSGFAWFMKTRKGFADVM